MTEVSVLHVTSGLHPASGGTSVAVIQLNEALSEIPDLSVGLLFQHSPGEPVLSPGNSGVRTHVVLTKSGLVSRVGLQIHRKLNKLTKLQPPSLLHGHGLWLPVNHWTSRVARQTGIPLILHIHGMLEPWASKHKAWKKYFAMQIYQSSDIRVANTLIATSSKEYENLRVIGIKQPIAIIPNGVRVPVSSVSGRQLLEPELSKPRIVSFMSRIHPVKGLLNLVKAWSFIRPEGWLLRIAGPNTGEYADEVKSCVQSLKVQDSVQFVGELHDDAKADFFEQSDIFVLPSFSENFGIVVTEALAHGVPVITTTGTPWKDLAENNCGWWIDIGVAPLIEALTQAISLSDDQRTAMGRRGRRYVQRYNWKTIAEQTFDVYKWVLGQHSKPDCVELA